MHFPSTPTSVRNTRSDTSGKSPRSPAIAKGDKSQRIGGSRSATSVDSGTKTRTPRGRPIRHTRGNNGYQGR
jgi:hypothetical protein